MLGAHARRCAIGATKHDRAVDLAAAHIKRLRRRIDDMVDGLHREIKRHKFDDRPQPSEGGANANTCKTIFGNRRIQHALCAKFLQQALRHLIGALIFADLFAHHEDAGVATHLLRHRVAQGFTHGHRDHCHIGRNLGRARRRRSSLFRRWRCDAGGRLRRVAIARQFRRRQRRLDRCRVFALLGDDGDGRIDGDILCAARHEDACQNALIDRLDFHGRLIGLDLGDHIA